MNTSDVEISKELAGRLTELVNEYFDQGSPEIVFIALMNVLAFCLSRLDMDNRKAVARYIQKAIPRMLEFAGKIDDFISDDQLHHRH
jgi:hypothetical protein